MQCSCVQRMEFVIGSNANSNFKTQRIFFRSTPLWIGRKWLSYKGEWSISVHFLNFISIQSCATPEEVHERLHNLSTFSNLLLHVDHRQNQYIWLFSKFGTSSTLHKYIYIHMKVYTCICTSTQNQKSKYDIYNRRNMHLLLHTTYSVAHRSYWLQL